MTVAADAQTLESGALVELFDLDVTALGDTIHRFHAYTQVGNITWNGNAYAPWPIQAQGFARTSTQQPVPTINVGNIDGSITALCLAFDDLVGATITRRRTLGKYLDAVNFGGTNPTADPTQEMPKEVWFIERKANEDSSVVSFDLSSAIDFNGIQLPRRQIIANVCSWAYRSAECGYTGGAVAKADDTATAVLGLDVCGKRVASCKLRFGAANPLNYGGFAACGLIR